MPPARRTAIALIVICGALGAFTTASATAVLKGTLTATEFKQLSRATAELNASATAKSIDWRKARGACRHIGTASAVLRSQRTSCLDSMIALEALARFPSEQARCAATDTTPTRSTSTSTTTPTTATSTTSSAQSPVIRLIVCLSPRYAALRRYARALYSADTAARAQARRRGFTATCLATLASTPAELRTERAFATSTAKLAKDVALLIKVTRGQAPAGQLNQVLMDNDVSRFERSGRAVLEQRSPRKLSVCPHR